MLVKEFLTCSIGFTLTICLLSGCSDNPDRQAARAVQEQTAQTLDSLQGHVNDEKLTQAQASLDSAIARPGGGASKDSALLASGNLQLMQVRQAVINMELTAVPVTEQIRQIQEYARRVGQIQLQSRRIEQLLAEGDQEMQDLETYVSRQDEQNPGLRVQLAAEKAKLADLMDQKAQWQQKADAADRQLQQLQTKADDALRRAQLAKDTEKAQLEETGYDLLLQKKQYYLEKQSALDQVALVDAQIALVRPSAERLESNLQQTEEKIDQLRQSAQLEQLRKIKLDLAAEEETEKQNVVQQIHELQEYADTFRTTSEKVVADLEKIVEVLAQVRSRDPQPVVKFKTAQAYALLGSVQAARLYFETDLGAAVAGLSQAVGQEIKPLLEQASPQVDEEELFTRTAAYFDKADEAFEAALSSSQGLDKAFEADVTKSRLIALDEKMRLADRLNRYELAENTQTRLEELRKAAAEKLGPSFTLSETARLLESGLNYTPRVPFDSELYFESIKSQLVAWKSLRGPEREQTALQTLEAIKQLETQADETLLGLLAPEKRAIETAIEQGFPEETAPVSAPGPGEPNGL